MSMPEAEGFAASAQGLQGLRQQQQDLRALVDSGQLALKPGTAEKAAGACRGLIAELDEELWEVRRLAESDGFGEIGRAHV